MTSTDRASLDRVIDGLEKKAFQVRDQRNAAIRLLEVIEAGFTYDPGHSDLDNEQVIHVRLTLGDYRRICRLIVTAKGTREGSNG